MNDTGIASTSRGLVGDTVFAVLPAVEPIHTFAITIAFQCVSCLFCSRGSAVHSKQIFLNKLWRNATYKSFVLALTLCGYTSFMFGWHVHEKAILLVLVPLRFASCPLQVSLRFSPFVFSLLAADNHAYFRLFVIASIAGIYSLFPLLFTPAGESHFLQLFIPPHECHRNPNCINIFSSLGSGGGSAIEQTSI